MTTPRRINLTPYSYGTPNDSLEQKTNNYIQKVTGFKDPLFDPQAKKLTHEATPGLIDNLLSNVRLMEAGKSIDWRNYENELNRIANQLMAINQTAYANTRFYKNENNREEIASERLLRIEDQLAAVNQRIENAEKKQVPADEDKKLKEQLKVEKADVKAQLASEIQAHKNIQDVIQQIVQLDVLYASDKTRVATLERWVHVMKKCWDRGNLEVAFMIANSIKSSLEQTLPNTVNKLSPKAQLWLDQIMELAQVVQLNKFISYKQNQKPNFSLVVPFSSYAYNIDVKFDARDQYLLSTDPEFYAKDKADGKISDEQIAESIENAKSNAATFKQQINIYNQVLRKSIYIQREMALLGDDQAVKGFFLPPDSAVMSEALYRKARSDSVHAYEARVTKENIKNKLAETKAIDPNVVIDNFMYFSVQKQSARNERSKKSGQIQIKYPQNSKMSQISANTANEIQPKLQRVINETELEAKQRQVKDFNYKAYLTDLRELMVLVQKEADMENALDKIQGKTPSANTINNNSIETEPSKQKRTPISIAKGAKDFLTSSLSSSSSSYSTSSFGSLSSSMDSFKDVMGGLRKKAKQAVTSDAAEIENDYNEWMKLNTMPEAFRKTMAKLPENYREQFKTLVLTTDENEFKKAVQQINQSFETQKESHVELQRLRSASQVEVQRLESAKDVDEMEKKQKDFDAFTSAINSIEPYRNDLVVRLYLLKERQGKLREQQTQLVLDQDARKKEKEIEQKIKKITKPFEDKIGKLEEEIKALLSTDGNQDGKLQAIEAKETEIAMLRQTMDQETKPYYVKMIEENKLAAEQHFRDSEALAEQMAKTQDALSKLSERNISDTRSEAVKKKLLLQLAEFVKAKEDLPAFLTQTKLMQLIHLIPALADLTASPAVVARLKQGNAEAFHSFYQAGIKKASAEADQAYLNVVTNIAIYENRLEGLSDKSMDKVAHKLEKYVSKSSVETLQAYMANKAIREMNENAIRERLKTEGKTDAEITKEISQAKVKIKQKVASGFPSWKIYIKDAKEKIIQLNKAYLLELAILQTQDPTKVNLKNLKTAEKNLKEECGNVLTVLKILVDDMPQEQSKPTKEMTKMIKYMDRFSDLLHKNLKAVENNTMNLNQAVIYAKARVPEPMRRNASPIAPPSRRASFGSSSSYYKSSGNYKDMQANQNTSGAQPINRQRSLSDSHSSSVYNLKKDVTPPVKEEQTPSWKVGKTSKEERGGMGLLDKTSRNVEQQEPTVTRQRSSSNPADQEHGQTIKKQRSSLSDTGIGNSSSLFTTSNSKYDEDKRESTSSQPQDVDKPSKPTPHN